MLSYAEMHNNTVVFDIGRYPAECWQPEALAHAIKRHPDTQFVVCHLLAPRGLVQEDVWLKGMEALTLDNVAFDLASLPSNQGKDATYPYPTQSIISNAPSNLSEATDLCGEATCL